MMRARRRRPTPLRGSWIGIGLGLGLLLLLVGCLVAPTPRNTQAVDAPLVRVRVADAMERGQFELAGGSIIAGERVVVDRARGPIVVIRQGGLWLVNGESLDLPHLDLSPRDGPVVVEGRPYRGKFRLVGTGPRSFDVVNHVSIDDYLCGVVPREMPASWPDEALKAQAVAARTYAIYEVKSGGGNGRHFDVHADERSQVYGGVSSEAASTSRAVGVTAGLVLAWGPTVGSERVFKTFFSSTCGGTKQSGYEIFGDEAVPPLAASRGDYCRGSPRYRWPEVVLSKAELSRRLRQWGTARRHPVAEMSRLSRLEIAARNELGRPTRFEVTDDAGRRFSLTAEQTRNAANAGAAGGPTILSSHFTPVDAADAVRFTDGRGWGHGVGMCQWCAHGMARTGRPFEQILREQYPGSILVRGY